MPTTYTLTGNTIEIDHANFDYSTTINKMVAIREYIRDAYFHWGTNCEPERRLQYVLLVGDDNWKMDCKFKFVCNDCIKRLSSEPKTLFK